MTGVGVEHSHAADQDGHLRSVQRQQVSLVDQRLFGWPWVLRERIVAETVSVRLQVIYRFDIGLLLSRIGTAGSEWHGHVLAAFFRGCFNRGTTTQHDQVSQ